MVPGCETSRSGRRSARRARRSTPGVGAARALADLAGDLVGEADALAPDRLGDRRALRDLVNQHPQAFALDQALDDLVDDPPLVEDAVRRPLDDPFGHQPVHDSLDEPVRDGAIDRILDGGQDGVLHAPLDRRDGCRRRAHDQMVTEARGAGTGVPRCGCGRYACGHHCRACPRIENLARVTPAAATVAPTLSDERLAELLKLAASVDSVELKLTVPETALFETARALKVDPLDAQIRQVFFFDTPDLALNEQGVVVRARRVQGKRGDCVVKLRPVVPEDMPKALRQSPSFFVELDAMPGGVVCSAALKSRVDNAEVSEVTLGERPLAKIFSKQQRAFLSAACA